MIHPIQIEIIKHAGPEVRSLYVTVVAYGVDLLHHDVGLVGCLLEFLWSQRQCFRGLVSC